ncbi:type IV secretory system conjugative DNA transfer family protein [Paracoccus aurantiacus]|uniref:type IV secretory system conjugative DNA transfer family protein n=1 Tax=Paracoccus aurantiacus TaxID=2599412 RepID=UPI00362A6135
MPIHRAGLGLWVNPKVDRVTSGNDFSWSTLRMKPQSVYIVANSDDIVTLAPLMRLLFGELIATLRSSLPNQNTEPWPVQIILDEFDQLGRMPIVVQSLKQLAGHGGRVSIITQSIPGLDNIYGENDRLSLESGAGMKFFISPNEKKTAAEVSEALGKTTRLSVSDSLSSDGRGFRRRSVSRRNEERPLMSPDEVRKLDVSKVILIPERQNPILADRIVYYEDPYFSKIMAAQTGPLPYPDERHQIRSMRDEIDKLKNQVAQFRPLAYAPPAGITAKAVIAEVDVTQPAMTDAEAREALRPSDEEVIKKASDFRKKMKAKLPHG